jgi:hypothetical protein
VLRGLVRLFIVSLLLLLVGCGHAKSKKQAASSEPDYDWSGYKGGAADAPAKGDAKPSKSDEPKRDAKSDAKPDARAAEPKPDAKTAEPKTDAPAGKKTSKGKIHGESVSSVSADTVANTSKTALKAKVVSTNTVIGPEYEQLQVVLSGCTVQIIRPATTPDQAGPKIRSPKTRNDGLSSTDSGWYDADADVLVLVQASKKALSAKALKSILKH